MTKNHGMSDLSGQEKFCVHGAEQEREDRFGRMFPDLQGAYSAPKILEHLGEKEGPMDGGNGSDPTKTVAAGQVIFGQFIDHDITLDVSSSFGRVNDANETPNVRTPTLDLDCIYGSGPEASNYLYEAKGPFADIKLITGATVPENADAPSVLVRNDLARGPNGRALIGDFRNDENRIISQMQLGMINFHNAMIDQVIAGADYAYLYEAGADLSNAEREKKREVDEEVFHDAQQLTRWHYQWAVVNDFLVTMCGHAVVDDILSLGRKFYCGEVPFIPVEFSVAAYRFGHSMVPQSLQVQKGADRFAFFGEKFGRGFSAVPDEDAIVDWNELFDTPAGRKVQRAEKLDTKLATVLLNLPFVGAGDEASLATRNLLRGNSFMLPGGEAIAKVMGIDPKHVDPVVKLAETASDGAIKKGVPLWFYILAEAELIGRETKPGKFEPGEGLGPVGARIVAEVIIGLLETDSSSYLGSNRNWQPAEGSPATIGEILASVNSKDLKH